MIKVTIRKAARERDIKKPGQLAARVGISRSRAADLWSEEREPSFGTLDKICYAFNCELSELIQHVKTRRPKSPESNGKAKP